MISNSHSRAYFRLHHHVRNRLSDLLSSGDQSDVVFKVGEEQRCIRAHRLILSIVSDVFKAMFHGPLSEGDRPIEVPDLHPDGFYTMLKFVYHDFVGFGSVFNAINTLAAANKYLVRESAKACCTYLERKLTPKYACIIYEKTHLFNEFQLERSAIRTLILNTEEVINDGSFLQAERDTVEFILRQTVSVFSESQLFDAVVRWGQANVTKPETAGSEYWADIRAVVNSLLPYIRFLSMSRAEFTEGPGNSEILTERERAFLFMNIVVPGIASLPLWVSTKPPRKSLKDSLFTQTCCSLHKHSFPKLRRKCVEVDISVEGADILLCGIAFYIMRSSEIVLFHVELSNLTRNYSVLDYHREPANEVRLGTMFYNKRDVRCCIEMKKPELVCRGETCRIKVIYNYSDTNIAVCSKDDSAEVINGVKILPISSRMLVHEITYRVMDAVL